MTDLVRRVSFWRMTLRLLDLTPNGGRPAAIEVRRDYRYWTDVLEVRIGDRFLSLDTGGELAVTGFRDWNDPRPGAFVKRTTSYRRQAIALDRLVGTRYVPLTRKPRRFR